MANRTTPEASPQAQQPIPRWTAKRRTELVLQVLRGETSPQEAARKHGLTVSEVEMSRRGRTASSQGHRTPSEPVRATKSP